jgi:hypothetical protein
VTANFIAKSEEVMDATSLLTGSYQLNEGNRGNRPDETE